MKSTTGSQLAELSLKDFLKETTPTDKKTGLAFAYNNYANLLGIPMILRGSSPAKYAKMALYVMKSLPNRVIIPAPKNSPGHEVRSSTRWLQKEISSEWSL